jgi:hypothetical protein
MLSLGQLRQAEVENFGGNAVDDAAFVRGRVDRLEPSPERYAQITKSP